MVVVVPFLNEERLLPELLASIAAQTRAPDRLLLVDDGSTDASPAIAAAFVREHGGYATVLRRPIRAAARDRLVEANELRAFEWALETVTEPWDVAAKLDADLRLASGTLAAVDARFREDSRLGIAGPRVLSVDEEGRDVSPHTRPEHVEGATKFYRRACLEQIGPIPPILGWDTIDEVRARMHGWCTSGGQPGEEPVLHLRPMGSHDGALRAFRRWGACAYGYGEHPVHVALIAVRRLGERPFGLGAASYLLGWALAALSRAPRAEPELRAYVHRDQLRRIARRLLGRRTATGV